MTILLTALLASAPAAAGDGLMFTINSERIQGTALSVTPVDGVPLATIEAVELSISGVEGALIDDAAAEYTSGVGEGMEELELTAARGTGIERTDAGYALTSDSGTVGVIKDMPEGIYLRLGGGVEGLCGNFDGDAERRAGGGKGLCGNFDDDSADERSSGDFVFGTTTYGEARAAGGGGFVFGTTVYVEARVSGDLGKLVIGVDSEAFGEVCEVVVRDGDAVVYEGEAACAEVGAVSDPGGDGAREFPVEHAIALVWSASQEAYVAQMSWRWEGAPAKR